MEIYSIIGLIIIRAYTDTFKIILSNKFNLNIFFKDLVVLRVKSYTVFLTGVFCSYGLFDHVVFSTALFLRHLVLHSSSASELESDVKGFDNVSFKVKTLDTGRFVFTKQQFNRQ